MSFNDVSEAFEPWLETITGTRNAGEYVRGRWVPAEPAPITFLGCVQNANEKDLKSLPEGSRTTEAIKIHSTTALIVQDSTSTGDRVSYLGEIWLIRAVFNRRIGNYYKYIGVKQ